ncbi:MAG: hypothetical protein IBJ09_00855 [Bacteroidia bacterium]|nr:hypothetical protein [Bacteroidia bacterium]
MTPCIRFCALFFLFALFGATRLRAQIMVTPKCNESNVQQTGDLFPVEINNSGGAVQVRLLMEVTQDGETVGSGQSSVVQLPSGVYRFQRDISAQMQWNYGSTPSAATLQSKQYFEDGTYLVCWSLQTAEGVELGRECRSIIVTAQRQSDPKNPKDAKAAADKKQFPVSFHGNAEWMVEYGSRPPMYSQYPNWMTTLSVTPRLSIYDVPLTGTLLFTNLGGGKLQSPNVFSLQFDAEGFKQALMNRLKKAVMENKKVQSVTGGKLQTLSELQNLNSVLENPQVVQELKGIKELDACRGVLDSVQHLSKLAEGFDTQNLDKKALDLLKTQGSKYAAKLADSLQKCGCVSDSLAQVQEPDSLQGDSLNKAKGDSLMPRFPGIDKQLDAGKEKLNAGVDKVKSAFEKQKDKLKCDSLQNLLNTEIKTPDFKNSLQKTQDSLQGKIGNLAYLDYKKSGYNSLLQQKDKLLGDAKMNGWLDSAGRAVDQVKDLQNMDMAQLQDPNNLLQNLQSLGILKKYEKYLTYLKSFTIGTGFRQYSDFSLNNVPVNGISFEVMPKNIYVSATYGQVQKPVYSQQLEEATYKRTLWAVSAGYGAQEKSHFHVNIMQGRDNPNSIDPRDSIYLYYKKPAQNNVISADFGLNLWKNRIMISGELAGSQIIRDLTYEADTNIIALQGQKLYPSGEWYMNIFRQKPVNLNTAVDFAFQLKTELNLFRNKGRLRLGTSRVGKDFYSFGNPFLIRDMFVLEGNYSHTFWKNRIRIAGGVKRLEDNTAKDKPLTTNQWRWNAELDIRIPKLPHIKLMYTPVIQQNDSGMVNMNVANANVSYSRKIRKTQSVSTIGYVFQKGVITYLNGSFSAHYIILNQMLSFKSGFVFNANLNYIATDNINGFVQTITSNMSLGGVIKKKVQWNAGGNFLLNKNEQRIGVMARTGFTATKFMRCQLQFDYFIYRSWNSTYVYYPRYERAALRSIFTFNW